MSNTLEQDTSLLFDKLDKIYLEKITTYIDIVALAAKIVEEIQIRRKKSKEENYTSSEKRDACIKLAEVITNHLAEHDVINAEQKEDILKLIKEAKNINKTIETILELWENSQICCCFKPKPKREFKHLN